MSAPDRPWLQQWDEEGNPPAPDWGQAQRNPAAPLGLQQLAGDAAAAAEGDPGASYWGKYAAEKGFAGAASQWYTGANRSGTLMGLDTVWMQDFISGTDRAAAAGTLRQYQDYARSGGTGVALYDYQGESGEAYTFGDVFDRGKRLGNLYDEDSGLDRGAADLLVADFLFDGRQKARLFAADDAEERLARAVQEKREQNNVDIPKALAQAEFQQSVDQRQKSWSKGPLDDLLTALGGALGGAAVGAAGGPIGSVLGAVGGAFGAWMNKDLITEQAARVTLQTGMAHREFGLPSALSTGLAGWSGLAGQLLSPLQNVVQGSYDVLAGEWGDGDAEFYAVTDQGRRKAPMWVQALNLGAGLGDAALQFGSTLGLKAYMAQMSGHILGDVGQLVTSGGHTFDDRRGGFDSIFTDDQGRFSLKSTLAGIGNVTIDAVQLGIARGLSGKVESSRVLAGLEQAGTPAGTAAGRLRAWAAGRPGAVRARADGSRWVQTGGGRYLVQTGPGGVQRAVARRVSVSLLAPSERIAALQVSMLARREAARKGKAVDADDFYRAARRIAAGERRLQTALITGFGEASEEVLQAIFEPWSHGASLDLEEMWDAALQGFAMGAGMSIGLHLRAPSQDRQLRALAEYNHFVVQGHNPAPTEEERAQFHARWEQLDVLERQRLASLDEGAAEFLRSAAEQVVSARKASLVANVPEIAAIDDLLRTQRETVGLSKLVDRTNLPTRIVQMKDPGRVDADGNLLPGSMPFNAKGSSALQVGVNVLTHLRGVAQAITHFQREIEGLQERLAAEPELQEQLAAEQRKLAAAEAVAAWGDRVTAEIERRVRAIYQEAPTEHEVAAHIEDLNVFLRRVFNGEDAVLELLRPEGLQFADEADRLALMRTVSLLDGREPKSQSGSLQYLVPQASAELTLARADHVTQLSFTVLPGFEGDFDGDMTILQAQTFLDDEAFVSTRAGENRLGAGGQVVTADAHDYEKWVLRDVARASASTDTRQALAASFVASVVGAVERRYRGAVPPRVLEAALTQFRTDALAGVEETRANLINNLAANAGRSLRDLGRQFQSDEWVWLDQVVQSNLMAFQRDFALYAPPGTHRPDTAAAEPHPQATVMKRALRTLAAVPGQTLAIGSEGTDFFRMFQTLHYSAYESGVLSTTRIEPGVLTDLTELYEAIGQGASQSELDRIRTKDEIHAQVVAQLRRLAEQAVAADPGRAAQYTPVLLANLQVQDYDMVVQDGQPRPVPRAGKISLLQLLLRREVQRAMERDVLVLPHNPELQAKYRRQLASTRPGGQGKAANAERALVEVYAHEPLQELFGDFSVVIGRHVTVEQFRRKLLSLSPAERKQWKWSLQANEGYLSGSATEQTKSMPFSLQDLEAGHMSPMRSVLDSVFNVVQTELSADEQGNATGELAGQSRDTGKMFRNAVATAQQAARQFQQTRGVLAGEVGGQTDTLTEETFRRLVRTDPTALRNLFAMFPPAAITGLYQERDGEVYLAPWIYRMLTITDLHHAEMFYWWNLTMTQWDAQGLDELVAMEGESSRHAREFSRLTRRIHRVMYRLQRLEDGGRLWREFQHRAATSTSLGGFLDWVNSREEILGKQAPILGWVDDTSDFDPDKAGGGWTKNMGMAEIRTAIADLQTSMAGLLTSVQQEHEAVLKDQALIRHLKLAGTDLATPEIEEEYARYVAVVESAARRRVGIGPSAMLYQTIGSLLGFYGHAHNKAVAPVYYAAAGVFEAVRDEYGFTDNYNRVLAALGTVGLDAAGRGLNNALRDGLRTMDDDGRVVEWQAPDPKKLLELWEDPETRPFVRAVMSPAVYEVGADGRVSQQFVGGKSLAELMDAENPTRLLPATPGGRPTRQQAMEYLTLAEIYAREDEDGSLEVQRAVNDLAIARTSALEHPLQSEHVRAGEELASDAYYDMARALMGIGSTLAMESRSTDLAGDETSVLEAALELVRAKLRERALGRAFGTLKAAGKAGERTLDRVLEQRQTELEARLRELDQEIVAARAAGDDARVARLMRQQEAEQASVAAFEERFRLLREDGAFADLIGQYTLPPDPVAAQAVRQRIADHVWNQPSVAHRVPEAREAINRLHRLQVENRAAVAEADFDEWDLVGRAIIATQIVERTEVSAGTVPPLPDADRADLWRYYDSTFGYLAHSFRHPNTPLAKAAAKIHRNAKVDHSQALSKEALADLLLRTVFHEDKLAGWSTVLAEQSMTANARLDSASTKQAIEGVGVSPPEQQVISAATRRTYDVPAAEALSTVALSYDELSATNLEAEVPVRLAFQGGAAARPATMPLGALNGRFAGRVTIKHRDPQRADVDVLRLADLEVGYPWPKEEAVLHSGYEAITLTRVRRGVEAYLQGAEAARDQVAPGDIAVEIEFFHPDTQPAGPEWMHNVFYEGLNFDLNSDNYASLNEGLWFAPGGLNQLFQRWALDATKTGRPARRVIRTPRASERAGLEAEWATDLAKVLHLKTAVVMRTDLGEGALHPTVYNAVHKNLKLRHFVRGERDGAPVLWTAEQVIEHQLTTGTSIQEALGPDASLWVPSDPVLRTMLGEQGRAGVPRLPDLPFEVNPARVQRYRGVTARMQELFAPGIAGETAELEQTRVVHRGRQAQARLRVPPGRELRDAMDARVRRREAHDAKIFADRANPIPEWKRAEIFDWFTTVADSAITAADISFDWAGQGVAWIGPRDATGISLEATLMRERAKLQDKAGGAAFWYLSEEHDGRASQGRLTSALLDSPGRDAWQVAQRDTVLVDLTSYEKLPKRLSRVLQHLTDRGAYVILAETSGGVNQISEVGQRLSEEYGYRAVPGSSRTFAPMEFFAEFQTPKAQEASLVEVQPLSRHGRALGFLARKKWFAENGAGLNPRANARATGVAVNLVKSDYLADANVPAVADVPAVMEQLRSMWESPEGRQLLLRLLGDERLPTDPLGKLTHELQGEQGTRVWTFEEAMDRLLARWSDAATRAGGAVQTVAPLPGQDFGTGDIVPLLITDQGRRRLVLYRHGFKPPRGGRGALEKQWATPVADGEGGANIAVYSAEREPQMSAHQGTVARFFPYPGQGLAVELEIPLQQLGDKFEAEGMKYLSTPLTEEFGLPEHGPFRNMDIAFVSDLASADDKHAFAARVDDFRMAIAVFGQDFTGDLVDFFFPTRPDGVSEEVLAEQVKSFMQAVAKRAPRLSIPMADMLVKSLHVEPALANVLGQFAETEQPDGIGTEWVLRLGEQTPAALIAGAMMAYLMTDGADLGHVLRSGGLNDPNAAGTDATPLLMPPLFTQVFDRAPQDSELRRMMIARFNEQFHNPKRDGTGYSIDENFNTVLATRTASGELQYEDGVLWAPVLHSSGDNPVRDAMAYDPTSRVAFSTHSAAVSAQIAGADTVYTGSLQRLREHEAADRVQKALDQGPRGLWQLMNDIPNLDSSFHGERPLTPAAVEYERLAFDDVKQFRRPIAQDDGWSAEQRLAYRDLVQEISQTLGLTKKHRVLVDYWVRQVTWHPASDGTEGEGAGRVFGPKAVEAAELIRDNVTEGLLPVARSWMSQLHLLDLEVMFRASQRRSGWAPRLSLDASAEKATTWDQWVLVALGTPMMDTETKVDHVVQRAMDGLWHSYRDALPRLTDLPVSRDVLVNQGLLDPELNRAVVSRARDVEVLLQSMPEFAGTQLLAKGEMLDPARARVAGDTISRAKQWRKETGQLAAVRATHGNLLENGRRLAEETSRTNAFFYALNNLRVGSTLLNPALTISMPLEAFIRGALESAVNMLSLDGNTGSVAMAQARSTAADSRRTAERVEQLQGQIAALEAAPKSEARDEKLSATKHKLEMLQDYGSWRQRAGLVSRRTPEEVKALDDLVKTLGRNPEFKAMVQADTRYISSTQPGYGRVTKALERFARFGAILQDPTWGMRTDTLARRYLDSALSHMDALPTEFIYTVEQLKLRMQYDPKFLKNNPGFADAHQAGVNTIANIRSLKTTPLQLLIRGIHEPLSDNPKFVFNALGNVVLRLPLMFSAYSTNVAITILGLQGYSDAAAMLLHGRKGGLWNTFGRINALLAGREFNAEEYEGLDMSEVLEGIDLSRSFLRGGLTHTGLFVFGLLAGGLNLSGEDEEQRRRRRAAELQGAAEVYDPRRLENDFRNADAIFFDKVPLLNNLFKVGEGEDARSLAQLPWVLKQFVSPLIGIERFLNNGNPAEIAWGFTDAVGSMPLFNAAMLAETNKTFALLVEQANDEAAKGTDKAMIASAGLLTRGVAVFEQMLFENSFLSAIYTGLDRYDRDAYALPLRDSDGTLQRDAFGDTRKNDRALHTFVDPETGEARTGYAGQPWQESQWRALAKNRPVLAAVTSLFTGGGTWRYNMPVKTVKVEKTPVSKEDVKTLVSTRLARLARLPSLTAREAEGQVRDQLHAETGIWYGDDLVLPLAEQLLENYSGRPITPIAMSLQESDGHEYLTTEGGKAVIRGLQAGLLDFSSPALTGLHIPYELRQEIQDEWLAELAQEGVDIGLTEERAKARARRIWYGDSSDGQPGIKDVLWDDRISYQQNITYKQLNTTYVKGPAGKMYATAATRGGLLGTLGLVPTRMWDAAQDTGLAMDQRLNTVDPVMGINTGLRALERQDRTELVPTPQEIAAEVQRSLDRMQNSSFNPRDPYDTSGRGGGGGYGGRGGGGSYGGPARAPWLVPDLRALPSTRAPFGHDIPYLSRTNPNVRRATVRRERISSERGRLKSWQ